MTQRIITFLNEHITGPYSTAIIHAVELAGIALCAFLSYYIFRKIESLLLLTIRRSKTTWDDDLLNEKFLRAFSMLMPALLVAWALPQFFNSSDSAINWVKILTSCYILWTVILIIWTFLGNLLTAFSHRKRMRPYAIKGIFQMVKLIVVGIGVILTVSIIIGRSPASILMALGASAAIFMLVFKDTILGLVASVQLTANNMLRKGDWIVAESHGADGEVTDISLTTVKVRNWDNSITTVPPYSLISESFRNYQPMRLSGGRRVDRSILIDANSVRFCTGEEIARLKERGLIDTADGQNATSMINLRLLRDYLERYLAAHEAVRTDMLMMVRQMAPTPTGLPLQLYFFTSVTEWKRFEHIQSEIFDHVYAVVREFGLRIYQVIGVRKE